MPPCAVPSVTQVCASSTMTRSGQARTKSSRRRGCLMKSVETTTCGYFSNSDWCSTRPRCSPVTVLGSTSSASMPNLVRSSACHCSASAGLHSTASPRASPWASSSAATSPASIVLPMPTSSAISSRTTSSRNAMSSGTSWYGRGSTASAARDRNGPAVARNPIRKAVRSSPALTASPTSSGDGKGNEAGSTGSRPGKTPATSLGPPPSGRSTRKSSSEAGRTTHSRPRARTSDPAAYALMSGRLSPARTRWDSGGRPPPSPRRGRTG